MEREAEWKKIEQMAKANAEKMETEIKEPTMKTLIDNNITGISNFFKKYIYNNNYYFIIYFSK